MGADLALITAELDEVVAQRTVLRDKHKGATMPEEARAQDAALTERAQKLRFLIEEENQAARDKLMEETAAFLENPVHQVPHPVNADDEGRSLLLKAGWEISNGMIRRHATDGPVAFCPEEVLFGPVPTDDEPAAKYFKQTRAIFQPDYRNAYVKWLRNTSRSDSLAFAQLSAAEQNALSEGTSAGGGFVVPPDVQAEMLQRLPARSKMRRLCSVVPTSSDRLQYPAVKAHAASGSIYSSGFVGGWVGETPAFSDTDPVFDQFEIGIKKVRAATKLSNDWLADAAANMLAFLAENGSQNLGLVEDSGFIAGAGTPLVPTGVLNSGITTADVEGSTANTISNTTSATGSAPKLTALSYLLPEQYTENATWLMRRAIEGDIAALVDANARPIWPMQAAAGLEGRSPRQLAGFPVENSEFVPNDGTDGNKVVIFGDFQAYVIAQRAQISTVVLRERFADTDQTGIILFERVGGGLWNTDAFRIGIV
jgi:HK97 family phage major capsid protein